MNVYDSQQIALRLMSLGYQQTSSLDMADLVIVNTCTIRAKAEQKAFSFLGRLAGLKKKKPGLIVGVGGYGAWVVQLAAALGIGRKGWLYFCDPDLLELSNLPRIPYANEHDVGRPKTEVAGLRSLSPEN